MSSADLGRNIAVENEFSLFKIPSVEGVSEGASVGVQESLDCFVFFM